MKIEAIDLFCGIGGLTYGLKQSGIKVLAGLDNDPSCQYGYEKNNGAEFIHTDIADYDFTQLKKRYSEGSKRVLVGCAPCQPFSLHTTKVKHRESDTRWNLIDYFAKAVKIVDPDVVSMENVRGLVQTGIFTRFQTRLEKLGYNIDYKVVYCPDYGIPQSRSRLVLLGSKQGEIKVPPKTHPKDKHLTVKNVIKDLPRIKSGETSPSDPMHKARNLSRTNLERIKQSKPNGTWHDWDRRLLLDCYKRQSGQTYGCVYGRMSWDKVSPTITTQFFNYGSGRFGHPEQDRALSMLEGALLQTFPQDYDFGESISFGKTGRHIGNAVPPKLGEIIGKCIKQHLRRA